MPGSAGDPDRVPRSGEERHPPRRPHRTDHTHVECRALLDMLQDIVQLDQELLDLPRLEAQSRQLGDLEDLLTCDCHIFDSL